MSRKFNLTLGEMIDLINGDNKIILKYKNEIFKKCEVCGKEFIADKRSDQTRCSMSCNSVYWQKNNIEQSRKLKREWARKNKVVKEVK